MQVNARWCNVGFKKKSFQIAFDTNYCETLNKIIKLMFSNVYLFILRMKMKEILTIF